MVAVILAILAMVVVPQFSDAGEDVKVSALRATLQTVRSQLELYKAQHNGAYPATATWTEKMTAKTDADGTANLTGKYGPYLQQVPVNPFDDSSDLLQGTVQTGANGWLYDEDTGLFKSNDASVMVAGSKTKDL